MARRRVFDKYAAPAPVPQAEQTPQTPAEGQGAPGASDPASASRSAEAGEKAFESERLMLFGPPGTQKTILILAIAGLLVSGIVYYALAPALDKAAEGLRVVPMIFVMIHGALTGMLLGQLIMVYPDRIIILFTLMTVFIAETIFGALTWGGTEKFVFNRASFGIILAILFWGGFVGFWIGFAFYAKRLRDRQRFNRRISSV